MQDDVERGKLTCCNLHAAWQGRLCSWAQSGLLGLLKIE